MCYTLLCKVAENVLVKFMEYMYTLEDALLLCYYFVFLLFKSSINAMYSNKSII